MEWVLFGKATVCADWDATEKEQHDQGFPPRGGITRTSAQALSETGDAGQDTERRQEKALLCLEQ
jgi:hypothetical protein